MSNLKQPAKQGNPTPVIYGSIKNKIVASDLVLERQNCNFDQKELREEILMGKEFVDRFDRYVKNMEADPILKNSEKFYEYSREEQ